MHWRATFPSKIALRAAVYWKKYLRAANYKNSPKNEQKLIEIGNIVSSCVVRGHHKYIWRATFDPRAACLRPLLLSFLCSWLSLFILQWVSNIRNFHSGFMTNSRKITNSYIFLSLSLFLSSFISFVHSFFFFFLSFFGLHFFLLLHLFLSFVPSV